MFPEYLPGKTYTPGREYVSLGFLYEPGKDLPIGVSRRNTQGLDRVFLNCAICHAGSVRETPQTRARHLRWHAVEHGRSRGIRAFHFRLRI